MHTLSLILLCRCNAVNFARRLECFQCAGGRPSNPTRVAPDGEGPTGVLRVSGLEPGVGEEDLHAVMQAHGAVTEVRMIRDKYTGEVAWRNAESRFACM